MAASNQDRALKKINEESPSGFVPVTPVHEEYEAKLAKMYPRTRDYLAPHDKAYNDTRDNLEVFRLKFIERGRVELKSISKAANGFKNTSRLKCTGD